jgi:molybdopterin converting factor subunit 1
MVQLCFFASLRETLGVGVEQIELPDGINDISALTEWLQARNDTWQAALGNAQLRVALNHTIVTPGHPVRDGDEVAWFPPVTGG